MNKQETILNTFKTNLKKHIVNYRRKLLTLYKYMCDDFNVDAHERGVIKFKYR